MGAMNELREDLRKANIPGAETLTMGYDGTDEVYKMGEIEVRVKAGASMADVKSELLKAVAKDKPDGKAS